MAIDPVCGMMVDMASPSGGTAIHKGDPYYFCSAGCRTKFTADPEHYLTKRGEPRLWMEAYEDVQDAERFEAALRTESESLQLDTVVLEGTRRNLECFEE